MMRIGILTVSDRAARGEYEDRSGPALRAWLKERIRGAWQVRMMLVPDDKERIAEALRVLTDAEGCALVLTTGGTGIAPCDVTPEATMEVCERIVPGIGERMRASSWDLVPTAILSRQIAGIRGRSLIVNLPGSPRAACECLGAVWAALPHALSLLGWDQGWHQPSEECPLHD